MVGPDKPAIPGELFHACSMYIVVLFSRECHPVYIHKVHRNDYGSVTLELIRFIHLFTVCTQVWLF